RFPSVLRRRRIDGDRSNGSTQGPAQDGGNSMKTAGLREVKDSLSAWVDEAQKQGVVILRHGKPAAVLVGVEGRDLEEAFLVADPAFRRALEERRRHSDTVPEDEARRRLGIRARAKK